MTAKAIVQEAQRLLGADSSQPLLVDRQTFWTSLTTVANGHQFDRAELLEEACVVFLVSEQFVLYKFVLQAALDIINAQPKGMTREQLWAQLTEANMCPKYPSIRNRLIDDMNVILVGRNQILALEFFLEALKTILQESPRGLRMSDIKRKLSVLRILPKQNIIKRYLLKVGHQDETNRYHFGVATPKRSSRSMKEKLDVEVVEGFFTLPLMPRDEFLHFLAEHDIEVPEKVQAGDPMTSYNFINQFGVVEVNGSKVALWENVFSTLKNMLRSQAPLSKADLMAQLNVAGMYPTYGPARSRLLRQSWVTRHQDDLYYLTETLERIVEAEDSSGEGENEGEDTDTTESVLTEDDIDLAEILEFMTAIKNGDLVVMRPEEVQQIYNDALQSILMRLLTNPPDWFMKKGGSTTDMLLRRLQYLVAEMMSLLEDPMSLLMEMHTLQGQQSDVIQVTGYGGSETHTYPRVAAVIVVRRPHQVDTTKE
ncbi:hypothetical protein KC573_02280 [candidate division WWE3 bacterium]|uniref:Uncharacterized protein n=1 Tax=candidate division WWE3 bacterium TaxID=2053526 RepID=A0A955RWV2_UNCKA|nr:hypothetical protein [candidate division WWE3 bacterium]